MLLAFFVTSGYTIGTSDTRMKTKKPIRNNQKLKKQLHRHIKLTFLPHKLNQYRPHLIRRQGLAIILLLMVSLHVGYNYSTTGTVLGVQAQINTEELLAGTNRVRAQEKLAPLTMNAQLSQAAYLKGKDMFQQQYWSHVSPEGATPWQWFQSVGYNYAYAGENLAKNFATADGATTAWLASPEHKANMLDANYSEVGFASIDGMMNGEPTSIIVALYGKPASTAAVAGLQATPSIETPPSYELGFVTRLGVAAQSMTPAALGSTLLILVATGVALLAHTYRHSMPKALRQSWYRHHGMIKAGGMMSLTVVVVLLYSGGQL